MTKLYTLEDRAKAFFDAAEEKYHGKFDLSKVEYSNNKAAILVSCPIHGEFKTTPNRFLMSDYGCPKCGTSSGGRKRGDASKLSRERFVELANARHGFKYDYSKVEYNKNTDKVTIICPKHGEFVQNACNHLNGNGCPRCASDAKKMTAWPTEKFIEEARSVHGDKYDYSKTVYKNAFTKVSIICKEHGEFLQEPNNHIRGHGCPYCSNCAKNTSMFIEQSRAVHGDKYDYSKVEYVSARVKVPIICPTHGEFWQEPINHVHGHGCPRCANPRSRWERTVFDFISSLGVDAKNSDRSLLGRQEIDILVPSMNIGFECDGIRWHSDEFKSPSYHLDKTRKCAEHGIRLVHIFEDEWQFKQDICKSMIRRILGKSSRKVGAKKCNVEILSEDDRKSFFEATNIFGDSDADVAYGLRYDGEIVYAVSFKVGGEASIVRMSTALDTVVVGGFAKVMVHFVKEYKPTSITAESDNRWFCGASLISCHFRKVGETEPKSYYVHNQRRYSGRLVFDGDAFRISDCGTDVYKASFS